MESCHRFNFSVHSKPYLRVIANFAAKSSKLTSLNVISHRRFLLLLVLHYVIRNVLLRYYYRASIFQMPAATHSKPLYASLKASRKAANKTFLGHQSKENFTAHLVDRNIHVAIMKVHTYDLEMSKKESLLSSAFFKAFDCVNCGTSRWIQ